MLSNSNKLAGPIKNYNHELLRCIDELRSKRAIVLQQIAREEKEKMKIQKEISALTDQLNKIDESLTREGRILSDYDRTIRETEAAYSKILESSQTLLHVLKRETASLEQKNHFNIQP